MSAAEQLPAEALEALGNPIRREIVAILGVGPLPVGEIASRLPVSRPAVSKHLMVLEAAELVAHEKQGTKNVFRLKRTGFDAARGWLDGFWSEALAPTRTSSTEKTLEKISGRDPDQR